MTTHKWQPGDHAWLTVPSRDSHGYSKRNIGQLTIPVLVLDVDENGRRATIAPTGGEGRARVDTSRLQVLLRDDAPCEVCNGTATRFVEEPLYPDNNAYLCDDCAPRYIAGRIDIMNGPEVLNVRPVARRQVPA